MKTRLKLTNSILALLLTCVAFASCKKKDEPVEKPVDQQTFSELPENMKIAWFQNREFQFSARKQDNVVTPGTSCTTDNSFFVSNGYAQVYYGILQCVAVGEDYNNSLRYAQAFKYAGNTLTIGNLYRDNGITGNQVYTITSISEDSRLMVLTTTENGKTVEITFRWTDRQSDIPAKYKK